MKIITWNVNGIRSLKNSLSQLMSSMDADVFCFQETKLSRNQVDDILAFIDGYSSYFSFPKYQSGYAGVATYARDTVCPVDAEDTLILELKIKEWSEKLCFSESQLRNLQSEGRVVITQHHFLTESQESRVLYIFNVYCPRGDPDRLERIAYKLDFYKVLENAARDILRQSTKNHVIIAGDINTSHKRIDHCDPDEDFDKNPGRDWLSDLFTPKEDYPEHFVDVFRYLYPDRQNAFTCWNTKLNAREANYGTRIDYFICDSQLVPYVEDCEILSHVYGSDHCPVMLTLANMKPQPGNQPPQLCTKYWQEFGGGKKQTKLTEFITRAQVKPASATLSESVSVPTKKAKTVSITSFFKPTNAKGVISSNSTNVSKEGTEAMKDVGKLQNVAAEQWKSVLTGPGKPPLCTGHRLHAVLKTVTKNGPNKGRKFYACSLPVGALGNPQAQCNFFKWANAK